MVNNGKLRLAALDIMAKKPVVILPFIFIAFFETLALEAIFFAGRFPLSKIAGPVIRKFYGEQFLHYPGTLVLLPKLFNTVQTVIYIALSAALIAASVNIYKNISGGLPLKADAIIRNTARRYFEYLAYGAIVTFVLFLVSRAEMFAFAKAISLVGRFLPEYIRGILPFVLMAIIFLSNVLVYTFTISAIPLMVLEKKSLIGSLTASALIGARNFFRIFGLLLVPFSLYLPFTVLKSYSVRIVDRWGPEANLYVALASVIVTIFVDCFIILCVCRWLEMKDKTSVGVSGR